MTGLNWAIATYLRLRPSSKDDKDFNVEYDIQSTANQIYYIII